MVEQQIPAADFVAFYIVHHEVTSPYRLSSAVLDVEPHTVRSDRSVDWRTMMTSHVRITALEASLCPTGKNDYTIFIHRLLRILRLLVFFMFESTSWRLAR